MSAVERDGEAGRLQRAAVLGPLEADGAAAGLVVGVTGAPGVGKSSLLACLVEALLAGDARVRVAVLAIDPSSAVSGGAMLGDRVRARLPASERRVYFRSQASGGDLGGMSRRTFATARLLRRLFDVVLIETVGVGQSEIEIAALADLLLLVLQPMAGDHVQYMKAGVMEIPDAFVLHKCDVEGMARRARGELEAALALVRLDVRSTSAPAGAHTIFATSAKTRAGIAELAAWLGARRRAPRTSWRERERHFLEKQVAESHGKWGVARVRLVLGARELGYEEAEAMAAKVLPE